MTIRLGCEAADQMAAVGTVAVASRDGCNRSRPVPVMAFHGTADPIVNYEGGAMRGWLLRWAAGVSDAPT